MLSWVKSLSNDGKFTVGALCLLAQAVVFFLLLPEPLSAYIAFPIAIAGFFFPLSEVQIRSLRNPPPDNSPPAFPFAQNLQRS